MTIPPADQGAVSEVEQRAEALIESALSAFPDSDTAGPDGTGYKYVWDECTGDEQDWVKQVREHVKSEARNLLALVAELRQQQEQLVPCKHCGKDLRDWRLRTVRVGSIHRPATRAGAMKKPCASCGHGKSFHHSARIAQRIGTFCHSNCECKGYRMSDPAGATAKPKAAAEVTGAAAERRIAALCDAHEEAFMRAEKAEQQLADQSTALSQIVQEMKKAVTSTWDDIDDIDLQVGRWADRLDALLISGSVTPHQTTEQEKARQ